MKSLKFKWFLNALGQGFIDEEVKSTAVGEV